MASPGRAPPAAAAASPSPSASACGGASASASIGSDVPVSFRELELQLPPGWCLRDCGGGGHCLYLCVAAMLFGVDEPGAGGEAAAAAAAGPVQGPGFGAAASAAAAATASPGSYSWMLARWLRGVVSAFLVRDECVTAMLAAGLHGNLERAEAESDQQWLQRFKAFHLQAADGNAPPQDVDKEWGALAQRIQGQAQTKPTKDELRAVSSWPAVQWAHRPCLTVCCLALCGFACCCQSPLVTRPISISSCSCICSVCDCRATCHITRSDKRLAHAIDLQGH